jgi:Predicted membrane protein
MGRFIIYGLAGWCTEIFWTGLGSLISGDVRLRGWTYIWMFPIYGCAIFLEPIHDRIRSWPVVLRGGVYMLLIFFTEYSTGWLLKTVTGVCPWDYSGKTFSVNGFIRLDYAPVWFTVGLLFEKLHDALTGQKVLGRA